MEDLYAKSVALWQSYNIRTVGDLEKYLDSFRIVFAYNSGKIENEEITYNDTREIFENGTVSSFTGSPRTLFELQNQKNCYQYLINLIVNKEPITVDLVKKLHQLLTVGTYDERRYMENDERPGEFKKHDYVIGINEVGSRPQEVERDISDLLNELQDIITDNHLKSEQLLKTAAYFHARFEYIHPFSDGNGRVGRTLTNYLLMIHNQPPFIIYDEDKRLYFECLQKYDEQEAIEPLYQFFMYETGKTWSKQIERLEQISQEPKRDLQSFLEP